MIKNNLIKYIDLLKYFKYNIVENFIKYILKHIFMMLLMLLIILLVMKR
jgi:hypothetical protein